MIYLDAAATTPIRREVLEAMWPFLTGEFGNPSSHHTLGEQAAAALAKARATVAASLGCRPSEITFTSGGTESDNLAIKGIALANPRGKHIITAATEHEAVLESCDYLRRLHGFEITVLMVDQYGLVKGFVDALRPDTTLCTIMLGNNEIGTIQPIAQMAALAHTHGIPFHTDAVQAAGLLDLTNLGVDALTLAGHKIGAPKGTGALYTRSRLALEPLLHGGGQERSRRSGTENVAGAVALATALNLTDLAAAAPIAALRDELIHGILTTIPNALLTGHPTERLANNASFCFPGTAGEAVLLQLQERGILCSSGSACAAGSDAPSHVLLALGLAPEVAQTAVRFTLSGSTTEAEIRTTVDALQDAMRTLHRLLD